MLLTVFPLPYRTRDIENRTPRRYVLTMTLLGDVDAFFLEHREFGQLEAEVTDGEPGCIAMECSCGALIARQIGEAEGLSESQMERKTSAERLSGGRISGPLASS